MGIRGKAENARYIRSELKDKKQMTQATEDSKGFKWYYDSPLGEILLAGSEDALTGLWFEGQSFYASTLLPASAAEYLPVFRETVRWLDLYFSGQNPGFLPPLHLTGTPFRKDIWEILLTIPYGKTVSYSDIAAAYTARSGRRTCARAAGGAIARNPVSLIVPCHRVIGKNGALTGYAGGAERKASLLLIEKCKI